MTSTLHLPDASLKFVGLAGIDLLLRCFLRIETNDPIAYLAAFHSGGHRVFAPDRRADCPTNALRVLWCHKSEYGRIGPARNPYFGLPYSN
jgi:hypothetical protein